MSHARSELRQTDVREIARAAVSPPVKQGILSAIGNTPLVYLSRVSDDLGLRVHAKLELLNPGGSLKDRPALNLIRTALDEGLIDRNTTIIESSSGNLAIGLAQVCRYHGMRFVCVVDTKSTRSNLALLRAYGAEVEVVTDPDPETSELLPARLRRVRELLAELPNSYWPNQYRARANPASHRQTMREIEEQLDGDLDYLVCAAGTLGLLRGAYEHVQERGLRTTIVAVDARGSVTFGKPRHKRVIPGHGSALRSDHYRPDIADVVLHVDDAACVRGCRYLLDREAILAGGSSGAVMSALLQTFDRFRSASNVVVVLCDRGERYVDTIYDDVWAAELLGEPTSRSAR
ncbi:MULTISPECIES: 2,3-diaminopropionate biosynthesis protein SbnA [Sandaracinus]|uniref:2,3-diaminopropionate biosynthesis protein SbnA n=1 Tax=Sandaracinus TaxID=1055688 RepID=UPI001AF90D21|nr:MULTISPECIES: 2,3-diaminopropionate biosynthesis protein SbnA [Sandaracinus]QRN75750.1 3-Aminoalanin synthase [Sandaracinus sp.]UJR87250.1 Cystathionine beta-synthase [Sandaracinus amylolyticus]